MKNSDSRLSIRELILFGILGALTFAMKMVMAGLPNIEPVSLCVMVYAVVFGFKALYPVYVYVAMEILCFGLGIWNMYYLYIWAILAVAAILLRDMRQSLGWAILSGVYGLLFGALCGIMDIFIGGVSYAAAKWASGIPFDIAHCLGNFCAALLLFNPLRQLMERLYKRMRK
jgi:energy-coupling factor transport system substrate-specific component